MRELREILAEWERRRDEPLALATVVRTRGSAYRRPGARMLIAGDGTTVGSVSGGCLETEVAEQASAVRAGDEPALLTFDTTDPSDILFGTGTGCRGVVDLLIEWVPPFEEDRLSSGDAVAESSAFEPATGAVRPLNVLRFASGLLRERNRGVVATIVSAPVGSGARPGDHLFLAEKDSELRSEIDDPELGAAVAAAAREFLAGGASRLVSLASASGPVEVFLDRIEPPPSLIVFGAGYDAVPLVRLAEELGYEVILVDHRAAFATPERFPQAEAIHVGRPAEVWDRLPLAPDTSVVILTHNYALDRELLERLLPSPVSYIGLLGPALRKEQILEELRQEGLALTEETLSRLHAPIGLDLGADTPETVALAILAEMQAVRAGHSGGPLRERQGPIHSETGSS